MKTTHLLMILCMVAAGAGMALRALVAGSGIAADKEPAVKRWAGTLCVRPEIDTCT